MRPGSDPPSRSGVTYRMAVTWRSAGGGIGEMIASLLTAKAACRNATHALSKRETRAAAPQARDQGWGSSDGESTNDDARAEWSVRVAGEAGGRKVTVGAAPWSKAARRSCRARTRWSTT